MSFPVPSKYWISSYAECVVAWDARPKMIVESPHAQRRRLASRVYMTEAEYPSHGGAVSYQIWYTPSFPPIIVYHPDGSCVLKTGKSAPQLAGQQLKAYLNYFGPVGVWQRKHFWYVGPRIVNPRHFVEGMVINPPPTYFNDNHKALHYAAARGDLTARLVLKDFLADRGLEMPEYLKR